MMSTVITCVAFVLIVVLLCFCVLEVFAARTSDYEFDEQTYYVVAGDSLWSIATRFCPDGMDKREYIDIVKERNNLSNSMIYAGQRLVVFIEIES